MAVVNIVDERFMRQALAAAEEGFTKGEIPVGAVLVCGESIISTAHNLKECRNDPTAHAELLALREGAQRLGRWRLGGTLYVTLEPCVMCAGALVQARIQRLVFGAADPKAGGCGSLFEVVRDPRINHRMEVVGGVLARESEILLQSFFKELRANRAAGLAGSSCPSAGRGVGALEKRSNASIAQAPTLNEMERARIRLCLSERRRGRGGIGEAQQREHRTGPHIE